MAVFRETTFLDVFKPILTPRHPTAGTAHTMDIRACPQVIPALRKGHSRVKATDAE